MKMMIRTGLMFACLCIAAVNGTAEIPNEIVSFLEGTWWNVDINIGRDGAVTLNEYREEMVVADPQTLTVTAFKIKAGEDVTKNITISVEGDSVVLAQDNFAARGIRRGNHIELTGSFENFDIVFRLYLMGDTYIYQKDMYEAGEVVHSQMSYLRRVRETGN